MTKQFFGSKWRLSLLSLAFAAWLVTSSVAAAELSCAAGLSRNWQPGDTGVGVRWLQRILNQDPVTRIPGSGIGSPGRESTYFGRLTKAAVIRFQEKYATEILRPVGLTQGNGFVGALTRLKLISFCTNQSQAQATLPTAQSSTPTAQTPASTLVPATSSYPLHRNITAAVFWVGEPEGDGSSEDNALSAWDDEWQESYGGYDDPRNRNGYYPAGFTPRENPFYLDLPYNDFNDNGRRKSNAAQVVPWAGERTWTSRESMMKNRWVKLTRNGTTCYGQIQDAGPYEYDDHNYVFSTTDARPLNREANNAGMDVSPALRDCLKFDGWNNVDNQVDWQFVTATDVPNGPWKQIITSSQVNWP